MKHVWIGVVVFILSAVLIQPAVSQVTDNLSAADQIATYMRSVEGKPIPVELLKELPTSQDYTWVKNGSSYTSCYGYSCSSSFSPPGQALLHAGGAVLTLKLPNGFIAEATCVMKEDVWGSLASGMNGGSTIYRNCRTPNDSTSIKAKFESHNRVKLYMEDRYVDGGHGHRRNETYRVLDVLLPSPAPDPGSQASAPAASDPNR